VLNTKVCITATVLAVVVIIMGYARSDNKSRLWISTSSIVLEWLGIRCRSVGASAAHLAHAPGTRFLGP
jgi:hypothetical protein